MLIINFLFYFLVCHPLGVESTSIIPDSGMTASTYYNSDLYPYYGRLNGDRGVGAWCPKTSNDRSDFLEVDMSEEYYVCAVATQGHKKGSHWAKSYKLQLSLQANTWETYSEDGAEKVRKLIFQFIFSKFSISFLLGGFFNPLSPLSPEKCHVDHSQGLKG